MNLERIKNSVVLTVSYLYVLLFVYAAVSKLLDFENFQVQLGQSPLLSAHSIIISWLVPLVELVIAVALLFIRLRFWSIYFAFFLMTLFTFYIYVILNFTNDIPCSCGGVLEDLNWTEHLIFNLLFVFLAVVVLWVLREDFTCSFFNFQTNRITTTTPVLVLVLVTLLVCFGIIWTLFKTSDYIISKENPFIRKFSVRPVEFVKQIDLDFNSYYIAGYDEGVIYLGNYTAPLHILTIDSSLTYKKEEKILIDKNDYSFRSLHLKVTPPFFYLTDGAVPILYTGNTVEWVGATHTITQPYFSKIVPIDTMNFVFRGLSSDTNENIIGLFSLDQKDTLQLLPRLLEKQSKHDGLFDTDGHLTYSKELSRFIYVYAYRNEFIVADQFGRLDYRGNTIDTVSRTRLTIATTSDGKEKVLSKPGLLVNGSAFVHRHLLFVDSRLRGKFEKKSVFERSTTFDVYDLRKRKYLMSFYIPHLNGKKLHSYFVTDDNLYVLVNQQLIVYQFKNNLKKEFE